MLRLITGLPGHNKTSNTLWLFLQEKGKRPLYATHIEGFDYDKHDVIKLDNLEGIFNLPPNSLILCDEAQKFMRARAKTDKVPEWITNFETHRHLGIDLWYTTQHPMLIDVHVRRLTEEHWHYFRPLGIQKAASVRKWTGVKENPLDYHAMQEADISAACPPAEIFKEYKSTALDTNKRRIPKKFIYAAVALFILIGYVVFSGSSLLKRFYGDEKAVVETPVFTTLPVNQQSSFSNYEGAPSERKLTVEDYQPRLSYDPSTAPIYDHLTKPTDFPRISACMSTSKGCHCFSQQATPIYIPAAVCENMVKNGWFNNWPSQSQPQQFALTEKDNLDKTATPEPTVSTL